MRAVGEWPLGNGVCKYIIHIHVVLLHMNLMNCKICTYRSSRDISNDVILLKPK